MKFACDRCGRKYVLADEKIAAKEDVRMKCRGCGEVIVVKDAGEMVARSLGTPVPRLPLAEGALPPPVMPPRRTTGRVAPSASSGEQLEETAPPKVTAAELSVSGPATLRSSPPERTSDVDPHSDTILEPIRPSGGMLPRPSFPRLGPASKRTSAPPKATSSAKPPAAQAADADQGPSTQESTGAQGDRDAMSEPIPPVALSNKELAAPGVPLGVKLASLAEQLWLGASSTQEKRRMLIALGVGLVLGLLVGLVF